VDKQQEYVLRTVEERDVRFIRLWFTDVLGFLKSVAITAAELENAFTEGIGFDGSAIDGFARVQEPTCWSSRTPRPSRSCRGAPSRRASPGCSATSSPRTGSRSRPTPLVLKRTLERAADMGFTFYVHPEMEFFLFEDADDTEPLDNGSYFDMTPLDVQQDFRRQAINMLEKMGISVEFSHHEVAPVAARDRPALRGRADDGRQHHDLPARRQGDRAAAGVYATFMPKPLEGEWGSAMHLHLSLFEGDNNAFHDPGDPYHLSQDGRPFTAGLLRHAREITAVTNQWVNSYKRLRPGCTRCLPVRRRCSSPGGSPTAAR
jgi:glutamine synthetase